MATSSLSPILFDPPNILKPEVRQTLLKIAEDQISNLSSKHNLKLVVNQIILCGSMTGPDWDDQSDIDLHIVYDPLKTLDVTEKETMSISLLNEFLNSYKAGFNNEEYEIYEHPVELYFQRSTEVNNTPGIYDLRAGKWTKEPDMTQVEITDEHRKLAKSWSAKIKSIVNSWKEGNHSAEEMLRTVERRLDELKKWRQEGQKSKEGLKSVANIVFKMLRRNKMIKKLIDLKSDLKHWIYDPSHIDSEKMSSTIEEGLLKPMSDAEVEVVNAEALKERLDEIISRSIKNPDGSIDVDGPVELTDLKLEKLPLKFNKIHDGWFDCAHNKLTTLEGSPNIVEGSFYCSDNQLTNLNGGPIDIKVIFDCSTNNLTSLEGCPTRVGWKFECGDNAVKFTKDEVIELCKGMVQINV